MLTTDLNKLSLPTIIFLTVEDNYVARNTLTCVGDIIISTGFLFLKH